MILGSPNDTKGLVYVFYGREGDREANARALFLLLRFSSRLFRVEAQAM